MASPKYKPGWDAIPCPRCQEKGDLHALFYWISQDTYLCPNCKEEFNLDFSGHIIKAKEVE